MGLGSEFLNILKDTVKLTDSVERLNTANMKLQEKVEDLNGRLIRVETRLDTYVEIAKSNKRLDKN
jgi:predicted  nucleic acid-binding Zn-ribbon protein